MTIDDAIATLKAEGYRVTKPKAERPTQPTLNAVGKPFSPLYDPKYKIKTPLTSISRLNKPMGRFVKWTTLDGRQMELQR